MPLYNNRGGSSMPQAAQSAMSSATNAMAHQQKQETRTTKQESNFWDDLYKGARAVGAVAGAANSVVDTVGDASKLYDDFKIKGAYEDIAKSFNEGGYEAIQNNPDMQNYWHSQALGMFVKDRANSQAGYLDMMKKSDEAADRLYQNWRLQAMDVSQAYQNGDMDRYMAGMQQLVASSPMPYKLEVDGNGNFKELFRSDEKGGWSETGRTLTPQQAFEQMNGMLRGEQMVLRGVDGQLHPVNSTFNQAARRYMWATMMGNAENRLDPKKQVPLYDKNGNPAGLAVIQNPLDDYNSGPKLFAYGMNGKHLGVFDGYDQVMQAGLSPFAPKGVGRGSGRSGGGGGRGRGGSASGGADGQGNFSLTQSDISMFNKFATTKNEEGEKETDYELSAVLQGVSRRTGLTPAATISAYQKNIQAAMSRGASPEMAQKLVLQAMSGGQLAQKQPTNPTQNQSLPNQASSQQQAAQDPTTARINKAAGPGSIPQRPSAGQPMPTTLEEQDSVRAAQEGVLRGIQSVYDFFNSPNDYTDPEDYWDR